MQTCSGKRTIAVARHVLRRWTAGSVSLGVALSTFGTPYAAYAGPMSLPGKLDVSPAGAASYSIPIAVPPGTAGLVPELTLAYNSRQGDGPLGIGWGLGGLPMVSRCPQTMAQDGVRGGVNYDSNDRFCLDGQRLMAVSGTYGADGTEYRTEIEGFSKVVSRGSAGTGPAWFEVRTKNGRVLELGHSTDSQIPVQGQTTVRAWGLNKMADTAGNYLAVSYTADSANGQSYVSRIDYTGNTAAALSPYNSVRFVYETRPDAPPLYHGGAVIKTAQRLAAIETYADSALVARTSLTYEIGAATQRSRLKSVTRCGAAGTCLPATTFTWQDKALSFPAAQMAIASYGSSQGYGTPYTPKLLADINGDGKYDIIGFHGSGIYYSNSSGTYFNNYYKFSDATSGPYQELYGYYMNDVISHPRLVGDFDGDGFFDLSAVDELNELHIYNLRLSSEKKPYPRGDVGQADSISTTIYGPQNSWNLQEFHGAYSNFTTDTFLMTGNPWGEPVDWYCCVRIPSLYFPRVIADVNGDGRSDIVGFRADSVKYALSTGDSLSVTQTGPAAFNGWVTAQAFPRFAVDLNGDGKADLLGLKSDGAYVSLSMGTGFGTATKWLSEFGSSSGWNDTTHIRTLADVNGDGKPDLVGFKGDGVYVALNTGTSFLAPTRWVQAFGVDAAAGGWSTADARPRQMVDVNGDGKADIVGFGIDGTYVALSTGTAFGTPTKWLAGFWAASGEWSSNTTYPRQFADVDGNGLPDIVGFGAAGTYVSFNAGPLPDLLSGITTGLGAVSTITYKPLTDSAIYTKGSGAAYPVQDVQAPIYVVTQTDAPDGVGGTYKTAYSYAGAKNDLNGRGFLGFASVAARDMQTNVVETVTYRQDHPYIGLASARTKTLNALMLNQESLTYTATSLGGTRYFIGLGRSVAQSKDLSGTAPPMVTSSYQYDSYGNPTQVVVATSDGASKTTTNTYTNDTANWLLGRLTAASVTSVTP